MATKKFYLSNTAAAVDPAIPGGYWDDSASSTALAMTDAPAGANVAVTRAETSSSSTFDVLLRRWVSPAITQAGTLEASGTFADLVTAVQQSDSNADFRISFRIFVITSGGAVRGSFAETAGGSAWTTTLEGRIESAPASLTTPVACQPGDRVVFEMGYQARNGTTTSYTGTLRVGGTDTTDLAPGDTGSAATSRSPHITFTGPNSSDLWTSVSENKSGSDTGTGAESGQVVVPRAGSDVGTGSESGFANQAQAGGDSAAGAESFGALGADLSGTDQATGTESAAITGSVVAPTNTGAGSETGQIRLPGSDSAPGTETLTGLSASVANADQGVGASGGFVEELYADLVISLYAVHPTTGALVPLPDFTKLTLSPQRNSAGSITVDYPSTGINFALLRDTITGDRDLEVEIWNFGSPSGALRGYLQEAAGDDVAEDAGWTFAGGFLELRMAEALVWPQPLTGETTLGPNVDVAKSSVTAAQWNRFLSLGYQPSTADPNTLSAPQKVVDAVKANAASIPVLADPKRELKFDAVTPGAAVGFMMAQARNRGALTDIAWDFTSAKDSAGVTWPKTLTTKFSPGASYDQVLGKFAQLGLIEWSVQWTGTQKVLRMWVQGGRGVDRTTGLRPVVLRAGRNILEAPRKWSVRDSDTAMLSVGAEGFYGEASSLDAQTRRGRRIEATASANSLITQDAVDAYAQWQLGVSTSGTLEVTHGIGFLPGEPRPLIAFDVGDHVYSQTGTALDRLRVVQWTLSVDAGQNPSGTVTLNDMVQDALSKQQARLDAIASGDTVVGTSEQSQQQSTGVPEAPTGLLISSGAFNQGIDAYALVNLAWTPPSINTNGTALTDLGGFRVEWTELANPTSWRFAADVGPQQTSAQWTVAVGLPILYRVRAYNTSGRSSVWTTGTTAHTTETDSTPPGVPSTPTGANYLGLVEFAWNGQTTSGADMLQAHPDLKWCELHISTASNFTPDTSTRADYVFGKGTYTYSQLPDGTSLSYGVTYFCRLVAVDQLGNRSAASGQASAVPGKLVGDDVFAGAIGTAQLANAAVKNAQIDVAAVNQAQIASCNIGSLTAGNLTASMIVSTGKIGTRAAGSTGAGWEGDSAGIRLYNASNQITVQLSGANGSAMVAGEYRTSLTTGQRMVFNPNGSQPDEIRFYPSSTNQYGRMRTLTSASPTFPNQAGIGIKAYSPRSDFQSGEVAVFPNYARVGFGAEQDDGPITSAFIAEEHQIGMGGKRANVTCSPYSTSNLGDTGIVRIGATDLNNTFIQRAVFSIFGSGGSRDGNVKAGNINRFSYLQYDTGVISVLNDTTFINIQANAFVVQSERRAKTNLQPNPFDPISTIRSADWYSYRKVDTLVPGRDNPTQIGLVVDEVPDVLRVYNEDHDTWGIDLYGATAVLWGGARVHENRIADLEREVAQLRALLTRPHLEVVA